MSGAPPRLITASALTPEQFQAVQALVRDSTEADEVPPVREQVLLQIQSAEAGRSVLAFDPRGRNLVGYAHLDADESAEGPTVEIAVHPTARNQGIGTVLLDTVLALGPAPPSPVRLWAHGQNAAAARLARHRGFQPVRHVLQMRRSLIPHLPTVTLPTGVSIRAFDPEHDVPSLQQLNAAAFTELPDQGSWSEDDIRMRIAEDWFDPGGLLLAVAEGQALGFHWTKVAHPPPPQFVSDTGIEARLAHELMLGAGHSAAPKTDTGGDLGEVYVLGVHPTARGRGLGRALTLAGLHHLRDRGVRDVLLYVDGSNAPANALYRSLGFAVWDSDTLFRR